MSARGALLAVGVAATALAAAAAPLAGQLVFAAGAIGVIGMAHGASDLAIVQCADRARFLACYAAVSGVCLCWWLTMPAVALPLFLLASSLHFAIEDAPHASAIERAARGASLIATPALLHPAGYGSLLQLAGGSDPLVATLPIVLRVIGAGSGLGLLALASVRGERRLLAGTLALLLLPPLVGFAIGFLMLHALPQTIERSRRLGCLQVSDYLARTAPVLLLAVLLAGAIALLVLRWEPHGVRSLFAAVAALAMPHLLVTPCFDAAARRSRCPSRPSRALRLAPARPS